MPTQAAPNLLRMSCHQCRPGGPPTCLECLVTNPASFSRLFFNVVFFLMSCHQCRFLLLCALRQCVHSTSHRAFIAFFSAPESSSSHAPWTSFPTNVCTVARGSEEDFDLYGLPLLRRSAGAVDALASTMSSEGSFPRVGSFSTGPTQTLIASPD